MSSFGDDYDEMTDGQGVRRGAGGTAAAGDDVTRFLTELRALGDGPTPKPSPQLAAVLAGATPLLSSRRALRMVLRSAAVAALVLGALVVAAANHSLPAPAQRVVSNVVNDLTPFHIGPGTRADVLPPTPSDKPTAPTPASTSQSHAPVPPPSSTEPDRRDDGNGGNGGGGGDAGENLPGAGGGEDRTSRSSGTRADSGSGSGEREDRSSPEQSSAPSPSAPPSGGDYSGDGGGGSDN